MGACGHLFGINEKLPLYFLDCLFTDPIYLFESLGTYPPLNAILFFIISFAIGYLFLFFLEISFATLADTNSILNSLNIIKIKKTIDKIGWKFYTVEFTFIVLTLAILFFIGFFSEHFGIIIGLVIGTIMELLSFIIEFRMIGLIYRNGKITAEQKNEIAHIKIE